MGWRPAALEVTIRRYKCTKCRHVWRQATAAAAKPRAMLSRRGLRWALTALGVRRPTMARVADGLGVSWNTANDAVLTEAQQLLIDGPTRCDGVAVIGVDEHAWRHTRQGDTCVTVIIDMPSIRDRADPAAGRGPRPLEAGIQTLARRMAPTVVRRCGRGRHGWVHRNQDLHR